MSAFSMLAKLGTSGYASGVSVALAIVVVTVLFFSLKGCFGERKKEMRIKKYVSFLV